MDLHHVDFSVALIGWESR